MVGAKRLNPRSCVVCAQSWKQIMALRTFHAYPSIGGFASESTPAEDGDALCQIVKELVDNAVDACCQSSSSSNEQQQVKVEIDEHDQNTLQVTVSDNGVGMVDIQECVKAFKSTKGDDETAGRYGIGLTLCVLHAQRLVPNSYACIKSATKNCSSFTKEQYFVDTDGDNMECRKHELLPKTFQEESGTCVIVFVPVSQKMRKTGVVR